MKIDLGSGINLDLVEVPAGSFLMGSPESERERFGGEGPQHLVHLESFWMGKYPVTQAQWRQVVSSVPAFDRELDPDPSRFKGGDLPVEQVNWDSAREFCRRLSYYAAPRAFRLPSEAQWEYACRAGTTTPFCFGEALTPDLANYRKSGTTPVGMFPGNPWGLHDLHGNVWEWCEDDWHDSYNGAPTDGSAWLDEACVKADRLLRGGSWHHFSGYCRSASRLDCPRVNRYDDVGFRVVAWHPAIGG